MKTLIILLIAFFVQILTVKSQVNQVGASGSVGIGTTSPQTYLHVFRPSSAGLYTPVALFEDGLTAGYSQIGLKGTGRQYHLGVGNASETGFSLANKFFVFDQNAVLPRLVIDANGNMGIGTATPGNRLSIYSATANTSGLQFSRLNNAATASSGNGKVLSLDASGNVILVTDATGSGWALTGNAGTNSSNNFIGTSDNQSLVFRTNNIENMRISSSGNVSIGTDNAQGYKLAVNGEALFTRITVKPFANWPDYVFDPTYPLPRLADVEKFVNEFRHLPGITPANKVATEGLDLADNQAALLKKIEELTLYLFALNKQVQDQAAEITALRELTTPRK